MDLLRGPHLVGTLILAGILAPGLALAAPSESGRAHHRKHRVSQHGHPKRVVARHSYHAPRRAVVARPYVRPYVQPYTTAGMPVAKPSAPVATGWLVTVNGKAVISPNYPGSSRYGAIGYPTLSLRRPGAPPIWASPDDSLNYSFYDSPLFSIGPTVAYRGGRYASNEGGELHGIHKTQWTLEPGVFANLWLLPDTVRLHGELRRGFRDADGVTGSLGADYVMHWDRFTLAVGPRAKFGNDHFMREQFGITPADSIANPLFKPYKPSSSLYALGAYGSLTYRQSDTWSYTLHGGYDRLRDGAGNSPVVKATGSKNQYMIGAVVSYTFGWDGVGWGGF